MQPKNTAHGPPVKPGDQPHNRIAGTLADQLREVHQPRPTLPASTPTPQNARILEARVAALERENAENRRLINLLLLRTSRGAV